MVKRPHTHYPQGEEEAEGQAALAPPPAAGAPSQPPSALPTQPASLPAQPGKVTWGERAGGSRGGGGEVPVSVPSRVGRRMPWWSDPVFVC